MHNVLQHNFRRSGVRQDTVGNMYRRTVCCLLAPATQPSWTLLFVITEPGSQENVAGRDPNVVQLCMAGAPADGRFIAMASGTVSGAVTGPNHIVSSIKA